MKRQSSGVLQELISPIRNGLPGRDVEGHRLKCSGVETGVRSYVHGEIRTDRKTG